MTPREIQELFILALRIMGIWFGINALAQLGFVAGQTALMVVHSGLQANFLGSPVVGAACQFVLTAGASLFLLLCAPRIASYFYWVPPSAPAVSEHRPSFTVTELFWIVVRLLGIYALLQAIPPFAELLRQLTQPEFQAPFWMMSPAQSVFQSAAYIACGLFLILGAGPITRRLSPRGANLVEPAAVRNEDE